MPTSNSLWGHDNETWWQRKKPIYKFRLIVTSIIVFVVLPWILGVVIILSLSINAIF